MRLRLWGTRGSIPAPGPETVRYGGNTSCVEVSNGEPDHRLILDAGTGIRHLGNTFGANCPARLDILLTHLHSDHIMGMGFFDPLWNPKQEIHIWGPASATRTLAERMARYLSPPFFPVRMNEIPSRLSFHDIPEDEFEVGGFTVKAERIVHQGPTVGYRLLGDGAVVAYLPDHEPALAGIDGIKHPEWISGYRLAKGADLLLHDAQYSDAEYPQRRGWGHSSITHVVSYAQICDVKRLMMFHHEPRHSDAELEALRASGLPQWERTRAAEDLLLAAEGVQMDVEGSGIAFGEFDASAPRVLSEGAAG
jgi:phosphoribosyl 1,2-cyclic phosphodiesterase